MSAVANSELGFRSVQVFISLLFAIFWAWMRTQGFLQLWATAPPGAYQFGTTLFVLGILTGVVGVLASAAQLGFLLRTKGTSVGNGIQGGRAAVDIVAIGLFTGVRATLSLTPSQFLPDILEPSNPTTAKTFFIIEAASGVGMVVALILFVITLVLIIAQIVIARREDKSEFGSVEENPATGIPYSQQSFSRHGHAPSNSSREPLAMYGAPPATSSSAFRPPEPVYQQPQSNFSTPNMSESNAGGFAPVQTTGHGYNQSTTSLPSNSSYSNNTPAQYAHRPRTPSVFSAAPLSAIGQVSNHSRGPSAASQQQHRRGPSNAAGYHQRQQPSYSQQQQQPPPSPWAGQTAYGGASYQGQQQPPPPPTPSTKPFPAQPSVQRDTMQQAYAAHQQQQSAGSGYQPGRAAPGGSIPPMNHF